MQVFVGLIQQVMVIDALINVNNVNPANCIITIHVRDSISCCKGGGPGVGAASWWVDGHFLFDTSPDSIDYTGAAVRNIGNNRNGVGGIVIFRRSFRCINGNGIVPSAIPTFDTPVGTGTDTITIDTGKQAGTEYDAAARTIYVKADVSDSSTGVLYAIWAGVKKKMTIESSGGGTNTWSFTFTAADGVSDMRGTDTYIGRVYVVNIDESGDNNDVLAQDFVDPHTL